MTRGNSVGGYSVRKYRDFSRNYPVIVINAIQIKRLLSEKCYRKGLFHDKNAFERGYSLKNSILRAISGKRHNICIQGPFRKIFKIPLKAVKTG